MSPHQKLNVLNFCALSDGVDGFLLDGHGMHLAVGVCKLVEGWIGAMKGDDIRDLHEHFSCK